MKSVHFVLCCCVPRSVLPVYAEAAARRMAEDPCFDVGPLEPQRRRCLFVDDECESM